jgi:hypothetical protein
MQAFRASVGAPARMPKKTKQPYGTVWSARLNERLTEALKAWGEQHMLKSPTEILRHFVSTGLHELIESGRLRVPPVLSLTVAANTADPPALSVAEDPPPSVPLRHTPKRTPAPPKKTG